MLSLILGGARSGKSRYAQSLCCSGGRVIYVATAVIDDDPEMQARIIKHKRSRPASWTTVEETEKVAETIRDAVPHDSPVIVDCITIWIANLLFKYASMEANQLEITILSAVRELARISRIRDVIAVSNEVGTGLVPEHPVARQFRDLQGLTNQFLASEAERVVFLVAGVPMVIKNKLE